MSPVRTKNRIFSRSTKIFFSVFLLVALSLCIPVTGLMNSSTDNTNEVPGILNATGYENLGKALVAEKNWSGVIAVTSEGLVLYPYNPELLCLKGYAMRKTGHYQESVDLISRAIPNDTRPVRYANRGYALLAMGKNQDAIRDADSALALDSSYTTAYALKAHALRNSGNLSKALETIERALAIEPDNAYYLHVKGGILADMGDCPGAIDAYQHSIRINPGYDLPWPGLSNATADLEKTETWCHPPGIQAPPTSVAFPVGMVFSGGIIAVFIMTRRAG
jgi:tetratricopeptide (TPR) repeat protein